MHDPLETLLAPPDYAAPPPGLFERTVREVRRQRRMRRGRGVAALVGCYAAGLFTALCCVPSAELPERPAMQAAGPVQPSVMATDLEWRALEGAEPAAYKQAADLYLVEGAPADAVRCYGHALDESGPSATAFDLDDSWLLMAIKQARRAEREKE